MVPSRAFPRRTCVSLELQCSQHTRASRVAPLLSALSLQLRLPIRDQRQRRVDGFWLYRGHDETLAVGENVVVRGEEGLQNAPLRKRLDGTNRKGILPRHDFRRYEDSIGPAKEEFAAVASPARCSRARGGNLPLPFGLGEGSHVNLGPAGLVGNVRQPASVWGKLSARVRVGRIQVRERIAISCQGKYGNSRTVLPGLRAAVNYQKSPVG